MITAKHHGLWDYSIKAFCLMTFFANLCDCLIVVCFSLCLCLLLIISTLANEAEKKNIDIRIYLARIALVAIAIPTAPSCCALSLLRLVYTALDDCNFKWLMLRAAVPLLFIFICIERDLVLRYFIKTEILLILLFLFFFIIHYCCCFISAAWNIRVGSVWFYLIDFELTKLVMARYHVDIARISIQFIYFFHSFLFGCV